jgi:hypothetical protein
VYRTNKFQSAAPLRATLWNSPTGESRSNDAIAHCVRESVVVNHQRWMGTILSLARSFLPNSVTNTKLESGSRARYSERPIAALHRRVEELANRSRCSALTPLATFVSVRSRSVQIMV